MNRCSHHRHHTPYPQAAVGTEFPGFDNPTSRPDPECSRQKHLCLRPYSRHAELRNPNYSKQSDLKPDNLKPEMCQIQDRLLPYIRMCETAGHVAHFERHCRWAVATLMPVCGLGNFICCFKCSPSTDSWAMPQGPLKMHVPDCIVN